MITVIKGMLECVHINIHPRWRGGVWSKVTVQLPCFTSTDPPRCTTLPTQAASPWTMRRSKTRSRCSAHDSRSPGGGTFKGLPAKLQKYEPVLDCKGLNWRGGARSTAKQVQKYAQVAKSTESIPDKRSIQAAEM